MQVLKCPKNNYNSEICAHHKQVCFCLSFNVPVEQVVHGIAFFTDKLYKIPFAQCAADSLQCTSSNSECVSCLKAEECQGKMGQDIEI